VDVHPESRYSPHHLDAQGLHMMDNFYDSQLPSQAYNFVHDYKIETAVLSYHNSMAGSHDPLIAMMTIAYNHYPVAQVANALMTLLIYHYARLHQMTRYILLPSTGGNHRPRNKRLVSAQTKVLRDRPTLQMPGRQANKREVQIMKY